MIKEATAKLIDKKDLTYKEANEVIDEIMSGKTSEVQTAAFNERRNHRRDHSLRIGNA